MSKAKISFDRITGMTITVRLDKVLSVTVEGNLVCIWTTHGHHAFKYPTVKAARAAREVIQTELGGGR